MSNDIALFNPAQVPAFAKLNDLSPLAKALAGSGSAGKRISVRGGVFRLIAGGKEVASIEDRHLDVVIVNAAPKVSRTYYAKSFDADAVAAPDCWSADGEKPSADVKAPQCSNCAQCPQNAKGSGQGDSRACRYSQRLAVVLANDMEGDVMQLTCAATSIFGKGKDADRPLQDYARYLAAQGVDPGALVTRLKFDTAAATPKLFFRPMRWLTADEYATCQEQGKSSDALQAVTFTVHQQDGGSDAPLSLPGTPPVASAPQVEADEVPAPAPAPKARAAKAAPAPAPVEEVEEPVVRKAAAPAPAAKASSIADVISAWDDED
jgi:hypothetical protein